MKTTILFLFLTITVYSQKYAPEFYICVENGIGNFSFELKKIINSYCYDNNNNFYLCSACTTQNCDDCSTDVETVNSTTLGIHCDQKGWGFCAKGSGTKDPHYGYGVYKLKKNDSNHYIYIDTRDSRYGRPSTEHYPDSYGVDFHVIYNVPNQNFWWDADADGTNDGFIQDGNVLQLWKGTWLVDENGELVPKTFTSPDVTSFPSNYFQNSLAIGNDYFSTSVGENSTLLWGKEQNPNATKYKLYRAIAHGNTPSQSDYIWINDFDTNLLFYIDKAVYNTSPANNQAYYFIKSYNGSTELNTTNIVSNIDISVDWNNVLNLTATANNNPRLVWAPHPSINAENYVIYRAVSSTPLGNPESTANLIATVSSSTFEYTDNSILLSPSDYVYYFVKGRYLQGHRLTPRTNIVATRGGLYKENTNEEINIPDKLEITNYPNPFNPSTTINYAIPGNGFTELKVYNIYGQLIETLVSGNKEAGSYTARFPSNGRELASGVYLYTLTSGRYKTTGKMTLIK